MRRIYLAVAACFILSVLLFIAAFVYLDREQRSTASYTVRLDGNDIGVVKIERIMTEEKILYRSTADIPFAPAFPRTQTKLVLDAQHRLQSYTKERSGGGASESVSLQSSGSELSFVAVASSAFAALSGIPVKESTFVFEESSPLTYLPIIENYDFKKGRFQGFKAVSHFSTFLPPVKRFITLTSIRDEYLAIGERRIKTECLILKIRNYPPGTVWVAKSDRSIVMIDLPARHLTFTRSFAPRNPDAKAPAPLPPSPDTTYTSRDASFKNGATRLAGTLRIPNGEGKHAAVLFVLGDGPYDRANAGLFTELAVRLAQHGFVTLAVDPRGIGSSSGDFTAATDAERVGDIGAALDYLAAQNEVAAGRIAIIGHAQGAFYASAAAEGRDTVVALVLMAPVYPSVVPATEELTYDTVKNTVPRPPAASPFYHEVFPPSVFASTATPGERWSDEYAKSLMKCTLETWTNVRNAQRDWISCFGKRCFVKKMREEALTRPDTVFSRIRTGVLIVQGSDDGYIMVNAAPEIEKLLEQGGNNDRSLVYFSSLDHFFGTAVNDGIHAITYALDPGVANLITDWLSKHTAIRQEQETPEATLEPPDQKI